LSAHKIYATTGSTARDLYRNTWLRDFEP